MFIALYGSNDNYICITQLIKSRFMIDNKINMQYNDFIILIAKDDRVYKNNHIKIVNNSNIYIYNENENIENLLIKDDIILHPKKINKTEFVVLIRTYMRNDNSTPKHIKNVANFLSNQTYQNFHIILMGDDYKNEQEFNQLVNLFESDKLVYNKNIHFSFRGNFFNIKKNKWSSGGVYANYFGIKKAYEFGYKYYLHLDDDDDWKDNYVQEYYESLKMYPDTVFAYSKSIYKKSILPKTSINKLYYNNLKPKCNNVIHSTFCYNLEKIYHKVFKIYSSRLNTILCNKENGREKYLIALDFVIVTELNKFFTKENPCLFIPKVICIKETDGNIPKD